MQPEIESQYHFAPCPIALFQSTVRNRIPHGWSNQESLCERALPRIGRISKKVQKLAGWPF